MRSAESDMPQRAEPVDGSGKSIVERPWEPSALEGSNGDKTYAEKEEDVSRLCGELRFSLLRIREL